MIRREVSPPGAAAEWILIAQIDHARLAGQLAAAWGGEGFAPLGTHADLLWAIDHHDDGWLAWDQAPDVEPRSGRPRSFTEMEIDDSLRIWTGSIEAATAAGPLQTFAVAGHFCALARRIAAWKSGEAGWSAVDEFLAKNERLMETARPRIGPLGDVADVPAWALAQLQFFDALSLWFCCAPATDPEAVEPPGGPEIGLDPLSPENIRATPWPFCTTPLNLEVAGRAIPARRYRDRQDVAAAPARSVKIGWRLVPA